MLDGAVHRQHAVHACIRRRLGEGFVTHVVNRVQIAHQHHGRVLVFLAEFLHRRQHAAQRNLVRQRPFDGALNHFAVRHRVGKWHAQFQNVRARVRHAVHQLHRGGQIRVAGGDVGNQGFAVLQRLECLGNAAHDGLPWTVEKVGIITLKTVIRVQAAFAENRWLC